MIAQKFKTKQMKNPTNPTTKKPVPQQKKKKKQGDKNSCTYRRVEGGPTEWKLFWDNSEAFSFPGLFQCT